MAAPPRFKSFRMEDYPGAPRWLEPFLARLNEAVGAIAEALSGRLTRSENMLAGEKAGVTFRTKATVAETWPVRVRNSMSGLPKHLVVSRLERTDGASITAVWSCTWRLNASNEIELSFQGLVASTDYRANIAFE